MTHEELVIRLLETTAELAELREEIAGIRAQLAARAQVKASTATPLEIQHEWGMDHGNWVPVRTLVTRKH
jgi:aromatic ring-opening dioxygenase catalytic subunit (LigB family)